MNALEIRKLPEGGYIVCASYRYDPGAMNTPLFACSGLDEALGFIQDKMAPVEE
jgi:hypothetical protein